MNIVALLGGVRATVFAGAAIAALVLSGAFWIKSNHLENKLSGIAAETARRDLENVTLRAEEYKRRARELAQIGAKYEKDLQAAKKKHDAVLAGIADGSLQLRPHWACGTGGTPGSSQPDESARLRAESAARIIGIGAKADAQIKGLQKVIRSGEDGADVLPRSK